MNKRIIAAALIVTGAVLLIFGVNAWGTPNTKSIILIIAGTLSAIWGSSLLCRCK
ncbi:MAG: hypothetical protein PHE18_01415 [Candidatus Omnitrophica bacterium]|nr:hypothetical protein [Candidatus Omnitrophota bacterium]MDD5552514.1 hypothetical protein [Candidatus Omnitrophota bacterium]